MVCEANISYVILVPLQPTSGLKTSFNTLKLTIFSEFKTVFVLSASRYNTWNNKKMKTKQVNK